MQQFIREFYISLVPIAELQSIHWAFFVVLSHSMVGNQLVCSKFLMHTVYLVSYSFCLLYLQLEHPYLCTIHAYNNNLIKMDKKLVQQLNFRVIAKQVRNLQKIIVTVSYAVLACYDSTTNMWTYLKFKGPLFLVEDKLKQKKIVILNQCSVKDFVQPVIQGYNFQLKDLGGQGYMVNFGVQDSITGWAIKGIWSQDQNIKYFYKALTQK